LLRQLSLAERVRRRRKYLIRRSAVTSGAFHGRAISDFWGAETGFYQDHAYRFVMNLEKNLRSNFVQTHPALIKFCTNTLIPDYFCPNVFDAWDNRSRAIQPIEVTWLVENPPTTRL